MDNPSQCSLSFAAPAPAKGVRGVSLFPFSATSQLLVARGSIKRSYRENRAPAGIILASESKPKGASSEKSEEAQPGKLKLSDKIWVAAVIAAFIVVFLLIVIYDVI